MINKIFTTAILLGVFYIVLALVAGIDVTVNLPLQVLCVLMFIASLTQPNYDPLDGNPPKEDNYTSRQIVWSVYATQLIGSIEMSFFRYPESSMWSLMTSIGLGMAVFGLLFRAWAVYQLGRFFTWHVCIQEGQHVVNTGPFRFVRHPSYTGALFLYVGVLVMINSWVAAICACLMMLIAFKRRITTEEKFLTKNLGVAYQEYTKSVKMIIPYVW